MTTGYVYDPLYLEHDSTTHPENKRRLEQTLDHLRDVGLLARLQPIAARDASPDELSVVHDRAYIERVQRMAQGGGGWLDPDTYVGPRSYDAAVRAAGGLLAAVEGVLNGEVDNAFALVRPPGHHALANRGMGFCLFNNIAVAARYAVQQRDLQRVLVVDYDLHHGNGTQDAFYQEAEVLYFSTHQFPYYPGTGHWKETGRGAGEGYTVNVPLPAGVGDAGYRRVFDQVLVPLAARYKPQLILASAGFDAHWMDPLGMMRLSVSGYAKLARRLVELAAEWCEGRVVITLEGGYNLEALALCIAATFAVLLGDKDVHDPLGPARGGEEPVDAVIQAVRQLHELD
jgi:acetoin utilization deacetylase AcuC-like enzyme